jgi:putative DNA methylase
MPAPRVLAEDWLPVAELGTESQRERTISVAIPPLSRIHVWWARRPLAASAGVVLAGLLPSWTPDVERFLGNLLAEMTESNRRSVLRPRPAFLPPRIYTAVSEDWYRDWLLHLTGTWGDPVAARVAYDVAVASGERIPNPYNYKQAYKNHVDRANIDVLHALLRRTWGGELPVVLDSTAGGGSIPFTAVRLGLPTIANDLNGVAAAVLETSVRSPARYGTSLSKETRRWGEELTTRVADRLRPFFPARPGEAIDFYLFANAIPCPKTRRTVPLSPDWWLRKKKGPVAVRMTVEKAGGFLDEPEFEVVSADGIDFDPSKGTVSRGDAVSPYDDSVIDGDYIKAEAQAGRMFPILYAIAVRGTNGKRSFRAPVQADKDALAAAASELERLRPVMESAGHLPTEYFPPGNDQRPLHYGMKRWADFFTPRQLLVHGTFSREFARIAQEVKAELPIDEADAILGQLALLQGKAVNWKLPALVVECESAVRSQRLRPTRLRFQVELHGVRGLGPSVSLDFARARQL